MSSVQDLAPTPPLLSRTRRSEVFREIVRKTWLFSSLRGTSSVSVQIRSSSANVDVYRVWSCNEIESDGENSSWLTSKKKGRRRRRRRKEGKYLEEWKIWPWPRGMPGMWPVTASARCESLHGHSRSSLHDSLFSLLSHNRTTRVLHWFRPLRTRTGLGTYKRDRSQDETHSLKLFCVSNS